MGVRPRCFAILLHGTAALTGTRAFCLDVRASRPVRPLRTYIMSAVNSSFVTVQASQGQRAILIHHKTTDFPTLTILAIPMLAVAYPRGGGWWWLLRLRGAGGLMPCVIPPHPHPETSRFYSFSGKWGGVGRWVGERGGGGALIFCITDILGTFQRNKRLPNTLTRK